MKIKKFNENVESLSPVIEHFFVRQQMEVEGLERKNGDGTPYIVSGIGVIKEIHDVNYDGKHDIAYHVEFNQPATYNNRYGGGTYTLPTSTWVIYHKEDTKNIIKVF
jgi:hypothetical protein